MAQAFLIAQRSFDESTKCGCVLVSKDGRVLSTGYNGPVKGLNDAKVPQTRPEKYDWFMHAEENALCAYASSWTDIQGATAYITGLPCNNCFRALVQKGITTFAVSDIKVAKMCGKELLTKAQIQISREKHLNWILIGYKAIKHTLRLPLSDINNYIKTKRPILKVYDLCRKMPSDEVGYCVIT